MNLFKFLNADGTPFHGGTGKWFLPKNGKPGDWMPVVECIKPCKRGYHLCRSVDLLEWCSAPACFEAEYRGERIDADNKIVVSEARLIRRLNWDKKTQRLFAADCAERVLPIFEAVCLGDTSVRDCIDVARRFARGEATRDELGAARVAARDARAAAVDATEAAAWAAWAADAAARDAARDAAWAAWAADAAARDAARDAAWAAWAADAAARDAARDAAVDAARDAARDAERKWQTARMLEYLEGKI